MLYVLGAICLAALFLMIATSDGCCTYSLLSLETPAIIFCGCVAISGIFMVG